MMIYHADTLIVGSGLAGLMAAHSLSTDQIVICLTKGKWNDCNSFLAQGGIAGVTSPDDSWSDHSADTITAGRGHNDEPIVKSLIQRSAGIIDQFIHLGVPFDQTHGRLARTLEGGHRFPRIHHAGGDATGKHIMMTLKKQCPPHITIHEQTQAMELIIENGKCIGLWARNPNDDLVLYIANHIILATGGVGQLYCQTSNAPTITGDGIALAYRAGARCTDMEFIQFHPTLLHTDNKNSGLISEAVRGEGAIIVNRRSQSIMEGKHPLKDLAPRDIVARAIYESILDGEELFLDIRRVKNFEHRFPTIYQLCRQAGLDLNKKRIPIAPGAHFIMGGVETDASGRTSIENLYAIGETACTGVHGANRLASNSLLEAADFAIRTATLINQNKTRHRYHGSVTELLQSTPINSDLPTKEKIQSMVTRYLGIIRHKQDLLKIKDWLLPIIENYKDINPRQLTKAEAERLNMVTVAWLMTSSMLERTESRGAHFRTDFPNEDPHWLKKRIIREDTIIEYC